MTVVVRVSKSFKVAVKPLLKRYPSLQKDLLALEAELVSNPSMGTPLGNNAYKIRLKISSKGKGKKWWSKNNFFTRRAPACSGRCRTRGCNSNTDHDL